MDPFIVNPEGYDKRAELVRAVTYVEAFLDLNGIKRVDRYLWTPDDPLAPPGDNPWHRNGWYWQGNLFVNLKRSKTPVKTPGFAWSYTGFKADLTAPGILAHEIGHHVWFEHVARNFSNRVTRDELLALMSVQSEAPVSGYEPNSHEVFAEAMRLFILNPTLLKEGRPGRWAALQGFGLRPLHDAPWRDVLVHAHPKIIRAAESWIER
jgi:hypothetical protein